MKDIEVKADALEESFDAIEANGSNAEGIAALNAELALLKRKIADGSIAAKRPILDGVKSGEQSAFTAQYLRQGIERGVELKALAATTDPIGGFAVPREIDQAIGETLVAISPIRQIANVVKVGTANYRKLVATGGTPSGWMAFDGARIETSTPTFTEIVPASGDLYANPAATQQMLDDAMFNVEEWLAHEIAIEFARAEGAAFVKGTGASQPLGFLTSPNAITLDGVRPMGTLQSIGTGVAGGFPAANPQDKLMDLVQSLRQPYRQGACFVMNSTTAMAIRKFKTTDNAYIWQPGLISGSPATLLGYPVVEAEDMPDVAASSLSIAFGNFKQGYTITERNATSILRDPYTHKPYVHFYATRRIGGQVTNSEAIKLLKFA